jgi:hypothetical protein
MDHIQDIAEYILQNIEIDNEDQFHEIFNGLKNYMLHLYSDEFHNDITDPYDAYHVISDSETDDDTIPENSIGYEGNLNGYCNLTYD